MALTSENEYVLTTSAAEELRLRRQHDLWLEDTRTLWRRGKLTCHQSILEIGSGPGFTTIDLARMLGPHAQITAIELSPHFAKECTTRMQNYPGVVVKNENLLHIELGTEKFDAVFGRWIWMFLPNIELILDKIAGALKPGGRFLFQEYVDYEAMTLSPPSPAFEKVVVAIVKSFKDAGGEPDVVKKLIPLLAKRGFAIEMFDSVGKTGSAGRRVLGLAEWIL